MVCLRTLWRSKFEGISRTITPRNMSWFPRLIVFWSTPIADAKPPVNALDMFVRSIWYVAKPMRRRGRTWKSALGRVRRPLCTIQGKLYVHSPISSVVVVLMHAHILLFEVLSHDIAKNGNLSCWRELNFSCVRCQDLGGHSATFGMIDDNRVLYTEHLAVLSCNLLLERYCRRNTVIQMRKS